LDVSWRNFPNHTAPNSPSRAADKPFFQQPAEAGANAQFFGPPLLPVGHVHASLLHGVPGQLSRRTCPLGSAQSSQNHAVHLGSVCVALRILALNQLAKGFAAGLLNAVNPRVQLFARIESGAANEPRRNVRPYYAIKAILTQTAAVPSGVSSRQQAAFA
jgi:hypothetical protein